MGNPPGMPWRQQQFDVCGKPSRLEALSYSKSLARDRKGLTFLRVYLGHSAREPPSTRVRGGPDGRKYAVSQVVGYIKGKSAIHVSRVYGERKRNFVGQHFWVRGYYVSTVGCDERVIRAYIRHQEAEDQRLEQLNLWR